MRTFLVILGLILAVIVTGYHSSPWPSALVIRVIFEAGGRAANAALAKHVPSNVTARLNERYDPADPDAFLDVYYPSGIEGTSRSLPTIVWVHGGGFVSGSKDHISNYLKILAGKGYTVVGVDYSLAPRKTYPTPLRQVNAALDHLVKHAQALHVDASRFVLAGDSAGAQISAQIANIITSPEYANAIGIVPAIEPLATRSRHPLLRALRCRRVQGRRGARLVHDDGAVVLQRQPRPHDQQGVRAGLRSSLRDAEIPADLHLGRQR